MQQIIIDKRYKILEKIGAGGSGGVYKVKDIKNNSQLALKILSQQKAIRRFKREFKLLARLRHPHLCSVYDFGVLNDGRNYFTMEYIEGEDISKTAETTPYKEIYPWIVQLCRVLEYIHSKGLIHYDIKPGNVLIQKSGDTTCVKLMDFGLAGEQRIKGGTLIKGTFPYIAPEVIKGLVVDHRVDLYSFGVLLYEIFTKRSFEESKESFTSLLQQRIYRVSEPPSEIIADIPKPLERLIVKLIDYEPSRRFSRANEVIKEVNKLTGLKFTLETEKTLEGYLLSSKFVGREQEMKVLTSLYEKARQGEGRIILIAGNVGVGKSRLVKEFKIHTQMKRSHTFIGHAYKDKTEPLGSFYDIFNELTNYVILGSDRSRSKELKTALAVLFKLFPDLGNGNLWKNLPRLVPLEPDQEKLRNFEALTNLIGHCATELGELIILLEDLHWADHLTIQFLEYIGHNISRMNILICGTCRKEEFSENLGLSRMIVILKDEGCFDHIELTPLKYRSLYSFLDSTITPASNSAELVRHLMKKTGGNPFFVEEIMRTLLQKRGAYIGKKLTVEDVKHVAVPKTIEDVVLKRLKDLDQHSRLVVKYSAVLLKGFTYDFMAELTSLDDTELSRSLWELKSRQILVEEGEQYQFYHATLNEAVNKRMGYREKRNLFNHVGLTLERIYKKNKAQIFEDLAYYFITAKNRKKGISYGLKAAEKSTERYAHEQAISFYKGVLTFLPKEDLERRFGILQKLASVEKLAGNYDNAIEHLKKALPLKTGVSNEKIKAYFVLADMYGRRGEYEKTLRICRRVSTLINKIKPAGLKTALQMYVKVTMCKAYLLKGDYRSASQLKFDVPRFPKGLKKKEIMELQTSIYYNMGMIEDLKCEYGKGNYHKAIIYYEKAYECYKKKKDEYRISAVFNNLGICYESIYNYNTAFQYYQKSIQISEKIGDQCGVSIRLLNLGNIYKTIGCYSKSLECFQKALSISSKSGDHFGIGTSLWGLGECFLTLCEYKKAKRFLEKVIKICDIMGWKEKKIAPIIARGDLFQVTGDYTRTFKDYRQALTIAQDIGHQRGVASALIHLASVFMDVGEFPKAEKYIKRALKNVTVPSMKHIEIECYIQLCRMNIIAKDYTAAKGFYQKGIKVAEEVQMKRDVVRLFLLVAEIYYHRKRYTKGMEFSNKAIKLTKEIKIKDLYATALLMATERESRQGGLSRTQTFKILEEAKEIAEEIGAPELLWKIYFKYGNALQLSRKYDRALEYYQRCIELFINVSNAIANKSYKQSYLKRPDRQAVFTAIDIIERLI